MTVFAVVTVATEIEGRFTAVRFEKAFTSARKAELYVKDLAKTWRENVPMPQGNIDCMCERGVHELQVDEDNSVQ
jgi:hypothetical protein